MSAAPEHQDALLTPHLRPFLGDIEPAALALLRERLTWVEVAGGHPLMEQGEPGDSLSISISGRLRAYKRDEEGVQHMVREMGRGQAIGERSLYTNESRSASVVAICDSVLVRLDKAHFAELLASGSKVSMAPTRQIIRRLQTLHARNPVPLPVTIALLAVSDNTALRGFAGKLAAQLTQKGRVIAIDSRALDAALGEPGAASGHAGDVAQNRRISMRLDTIEAEHEFVLLIGDETTSEWTRRCCWLMPPAPPALHPIETDWLTRRPPRAEAAEVLVLLHPADTKCPAGTSAWLA
jgi:NTE family protein